jgi:hypothetical protein
MWKSDPIKVKWKEEIEEVGSPQAENGEIEKVKKDMVKDDAGDDRHGTPPPPQKKIERERDTNTLKFSEQMESLPKRLCKVSIKRSTDFLWTDLCKK